MVKSDAKTVKAYIAKLPEEKRKVIQELRRVILSNLPNGYEEEMRWGMITYEVPLKVFPYTYNNKPLMYAALAAQKNYFALYLTNLYWDKETFDLFKKEFAKSGKKLDMGKSCIRFKKIDDLPLDVIGRTIASVPLKRFLEMYGKVKISNGKV
ncbi:DUF1801 domain-containing protein [Candidatus Pacearchaeota archaeon]|nr:DUF1801 domain-containing protein [Candidatus Pacearchaeota archaeon]